MGTAGSPLGLGVGEKGVGAVPLRAGMRREPPSFRESNWFSTCPGLLRAWRLWIKAGPRLSSPILSLPSWNFPSRLRSHTGQLEAATMQEVTLSLLILLTGLPALDANDPEDKNSPFYYGGKCKCKFSQKPSHHPGDAPPLITPGSAHH
ncbi:FXYD domain-containing ion transport regulator 3 isoform X4 [Suricata suricatta]|uniref:FXYD domain-containing ion transport regulator 3 isoform X4 n=1 Tax=Suricata suricatta TaxID=37032 RepID=UPI001155DD34|nr:FXYD domain-containing ion transport regulator 3 isoform X4 [Suricata suricatta]